MYTKKLTFYFCKRSPQTFNLFYFKYFLFKNTQFSSPKSNEPILILILYTMDFFKTPHSLEKMRKMWHRKKKGRK